MSRARPAIDHPRTAAGAAGVQLKEADGAKRFKKVFFRFTAFYSPCNPLKSHQTAKAFFGNVWRKPTEIWKSLEKVWKGAFCSAAFAPPATPRRRSRNGARRPLGSAPPNRGADRAHFDRDRLIK